MNNEYFADMHRLIEKAKTYERIGREEEALNIYLEIHAKYFPNTSDLYERPAILLEKRKRFDEAIRICEKAIKLINEEKITGLKDNFTRRIERIKTRSDYDGEYKIKEKPAKPEKLPKAPKVPKERKPAKEAKAPKAPKEPKEPKESRLLRYLKGLMPTKETNALNEIEEIKEIKEIEELTDLDDIKVIKESIESIKADVTETTETTRNFEILKNLNESSDTIEPEKHRKPFKLFKTKWRKPNKTEWIALLVIVAFISLGAYAILNKPKSEFQLMIDMSELKKNSEVSGNPFEVNLEDLPPISASMIQVAVNETQTMTGVRLAGVIVQKDVVGFVIMLEPGASRSQAQDASIVFVKALARAAASENPELSPPGAIGYGTLFDYYTLLVVAGENYTNPILKGSKNAKAPGIYWRSE